LRWAVLGTNGSHFSAERNTMPRLEGEHSSPALYIVLLIVLAIVAVLVLEYVGVINMIPNFGAV
jgi:hypothetical protein